MVLRYFNNFFSRKATEGSALEYYHKSCEKYKRTHKFCQAKARYGIIKNRLFLLLYRVSL